MGRHRPLVIPQLNDVWAPRTDRRTRYFSPRSTSYIVVDVHGDRVTLRRSDKFFHSQRIGIVTDRHHTLNFETLRRTYELVKRPTRKQKPTGRQK